MAMTRDQLKQRYGLSNRQAIRVLEQIRDGATLKYIMRVMFPQGPIAERERKPKQGGNHDRDR